MDFKNYKGCSDKLALNYDSSVTVSCLECCVYDESNVDSVGCKDRLASNYNPLAKKNCNGCCVYDSDITYFNMSEINNETENRFGLVAGDSVIISDTGFVSDGWYVGSDSYDGYVTKLNENLGEKPLGFNNYNELVESINKTINETPNSYFFINQYDLKPWLVLNTSIENGGFTTFSRDCLNMGGSVYEYSGNLFGCIKGEETKTKTTKLVKTKEGVSFINVNPNKVKVLDNTRSYTSLLNNQINNGWDMKESSFFSVDLFMSIGLSVPDSKFVFNNYFNTNKVKYPNNDGDELPISGKLKSFQLLSYAFTQNTLYTPIEPENSLEVINESNICPLIGSTYVEGNDFGFCVGKTLSPPNKSKTPFYLEDYSRYTCPSFGDGNLEIKIIYDDSGNEFSVLDNVSENCCNNKTLNYNLSGEWTFLNGRCELKKEQSSCKSSNTITVSENLIDLTKYEPCVENKLIISAYLYFEKPEKTCNETPGWDYFYNRSMVRPPDYESLSTYVYRDDNLVNNERVNIETPGNDDELCCYNGEQPIEGNLVIQDINKNIVNSGVTYIDTFSTTQTNVNTNVGVGGGFNEWVLLTTEVDLNTMNLSEFYVSVDFISGIFKCCDYNIYLDDIKVECNQNKTIETIYTEPCIGFNLNKVIDNKKSWVYNPGTEETSNSVDDNIIRSGGELGLNIEQTGIITAGGYGSINRVFAPSVDAEIDYRDTDYYNFSGVIEKHSNLVLNSKELILQFNMCPDNDCLINPSYLLHDDGYIVNDEGGRIIVDEGSRFPNLIELERFKKSFQSFWLKIIEQFIPATTIFIGGEKWCNNRICEQKVVNDYTLDSTKDDGVLSPPPTQDGIKPKEKVSGNVTSQYVFDITEDVEGNTTSSGDVSSTSNSGVGVVVVGNYKLYSVENLDPELNANVRYRKI